MTAADAPQAAEGAFEWAMPLDGSNHIIRTGWVKPAAGAKKRGQAGLIDAHEQNEGLTRKGNKRMINHGISWQKGLPDP